MQNFILLSGYKTVRVLQFDNNSFQFAELQNLYISIDKYNLFCLSIYQKKKVYQQFEIKLLSDEKLANTIVVSVNKFSMLMKH